MHLPGLRKNFTRSIFPVITINFGPNTWTYKYRDNLNLPFGWCAIQVLGGFDPEQGGHLILWDLKLVIEFPPGATILIPSATLIHSNVPICDGETRYSMTQYTPGGIFRWVDNGFWTDRGLLAENEEKFYKMEALKSMWWEMGLGLFSTIAELSASFLDFWCFLHLFYHVKCTAFLRFLMFLPTLILSQVIMYWCIYFSMSNVPT